MVAKKEKTTKEAPKEGERKSTRKPKVVERLTVDVPETKPKAPKSTIKKTATKKTTKSPKKAAKKGKKDGPKRAATAFLLYSMDNRAKVKKENPDATFGDLGKLLGEAWANATASEKKKFEAAAAKDKVRYEKEKAEVCTFSFLTYLYLCNCLLLHYVCLWYLQRFSFSLRRRTKHCGNTLICDVVARVRGDTSAGSTRACNFMYFIF